jgi:hypothetical protein
VILFGADDGGVRPYELGLGVIDKAIGALHRSALRRQRGVRCRFVVDGSA